MRQRPRPAWPLLAVLLLLAVSGCDVSERLDPPVSGCTLIGCESAIAFNIAGAGLKGQAGTVKAEICFNGTCESARLRVGASGAVDAKGNRSLIDASGNDIAVTLFLPDDDYDSETLHDVSLNLTVDGGKPVIVRRSVALSPSQPNGPNCEPVCWSTAIRV